MTANKPPSPEDDRLTDWASQHGPAVRGYLRALLRRPDEADDLTQEVFRRAWRARDRYREQGTARAYLLRIADRLARDQARKNRREVNLNPESWEAVEPADTRQDPAEQMQQTETQRQLAAALDSLSPTQRRVLLLRYYGQLSFAEIAETIPCPLSTALSHCHRGLLALRELFAETLS